MKDKILKLAEEIDNHIKCLDAVIDISKDFTSNHLLADAIGSRTEILITISSRLKEIIKSEDIAL